MSFIQYPGLGLNYYPCRYGRSRVVFRGPRRKLIGRYVGFIGGTETYGRFIPEPFPALIEKKIGLPCINFGCMNAGLDVYLNDPEVLRSLEAAEVVVMQALGAHNMSNRFYSVHPRRNDRFLRASEALQDLYPEVDFTEFNFTRHLLSALQAKCPTRFQDVVDELQAAWVSRMKYVKRLLHGPLVLVWFAEDRPATDFGPIDGQLPQLVTKAMIEAVLPRENNYVEMTPSEHAKARGTRGMVFTDLEKSAAEQALGPLAHQDLAEALIPLLKRILGSCGAKRKAHPEGRPLQNGAGGS